MCMETDPSLEELLGEVLPEWVGPLCSLCLHAYCCNVIGSSGHLLQRQCGVVCHEERQSPDEAVPRTLSVEKHKQKAK